MAMKKISEFVSATPISEDKILFEHNGSGKSTTLADLPISAQTQTALDVKVNTANVLTFDEIQGTTDLTGKVASANALKNTLPKAGYHNDGEQLNFLINKPCIIIVKGEGNSNYSIGIIARLDLNDVRIILSDAVYDPNIIYEASTRLLTLPTGGWYSYIII